MTRVRNMIYPHVYMHIWKDISKSDGIERLHSSAVTWDVENISLQVNLAVHGSMSTIMYVWYRANICMLLTGECVYACVCLCERGMNEECVCVCVYGGGMFVVVTCQHVTTSIVGVGYHYVQYLDVINNHLQAHESRWHVWSMCQVWLTSHEGNLVYHLIQLRQK